MRTKAHNEIYLRYKANHSFPHPYIFQMVKTLHRNPRFNISIDIDISGLHDISKKFLMKLIHHNMSKNQVKFSRKTRLN